MYFEILDEITNIETIAVGSGIRDIKRLRKQFGPGRWSQAQRHSASKTAQWKDTTS